MLIVCRAYNGAQTGSEHGSDHAMVRARLRLRMKAPRIPNRLAKFDMAKMKTASLEHLRLDLQNRVEGLHLDEQARLARIQSAPNHRDLRRLRWFGHAARRPEGELIKDLLLSTLPRTWRRRAGGQLKTWASTIKADLEPISAPQVFGHARWRWTG